MHNTLKSTLYGLLCSVGLFVSACAGSGNDELVSMVDSDSGDALAFDEYSPTRDKGVARFNNPDGEVLDGELAPPDAEVEVQDGEVLDGELAPPDAEVEAQDGEVLDGELAPPDAEVEAQDGESPADSAAECAPIGRWQVYINPQIICFRLNGPEVSFIDVESASGCYADLEISLDINEPESLYGRFLGTITYHLTFTVDTLTGNAEIIGTVTNGAGSMDCETTAYITGVRR